MVSQTPQRMLYHNRRTKGDQVRYRFPYRQAQLTENILSLTGIAVLLTAGNDTVVHCSRSIRTILGIAAADVMHKGWSTLFDRIHPSDQKLITRKIHPELRKIIRGMNRERAETVRFNYTFRIRHFNGEYITAALENQLVRGDTKVCMSVLKNISALSEPGKMVLNVRKKENNDTWKSVVQREYPLQAEGFSTRETQIIRAVADGLSSREMAEQFFISAETIRCHRKKIMEKTGCASSAELVGFALQNKII